MLRDGVATGEFTLRRSRTPPPGGSPRCSTASGIQVTVHDKAVTLDELRAWVLVAAATEVGIDPSQFDR